MVAGARGEKKTRERGRSENVSEFEEISALGLCYSLNEESRQGPTNLKKRNPIFTP